MQGFKDLEVYQLAYKLAMRIFELSGAFPREERYALTEQIRWASRTACSNIAEGYSKRAYLKYFVSKMSDADAEASETLVWPDFARDRGYLPVDDHHNLYAKYQRVGSQMLRNKPGELIFSNPELPAGTYQLKVCSIREHLPPSPRLRWASPFTY